MNETKIRKPKPSKKQAVAQLLTEVPTGAPGVAPALARSVWTPAISRRSHTLTKTAVIAVTTLLCCLTLCISLNAQAAGDVVQQIKQLQQDFNSAQMKNDVSWAQEHLADGYMAGNSWGAWQTKEDVVKGMQNKTNRYKSADISDMHGATFGSNIAVSHYTSTYDAELNGTHRARTVICSDTWVNDSGTWKTASSHCSRVKGM